MSPQPSPPPSHIHLQPPDPSPQQPDALLVLLPLLIVLSTFLFLLLIFLVCVLLIRRRRGIVLRDNDGPVDMSREELIEGEGGFEGVEERWLESVDESVRRAYNRAKGSFPSLPSYCAPGPSFISSPQSTNCNTLPTPFRPISRYRNSSQFKRKAYPHGPLSQTTKL